MPLWGCSSACMSRGGHSGNERWVTPAALRIGADAGSWGSIQKHAGLSTAAPESAVNSRALAALSTKTVCRPGAHTANPRVPAPDKDAR